VIKFTQIDAVYLQDHYYLQPEDKCYFLREYSSHKTFEFGATNSLISNLKKSVRRKGLPEYKYKAAAIRQCGKEIREALGQEALSRYTWVPIPPSKSKQDPEYDDRLLRVLRNINEEGTLDIRELVYQCQSMEPAHSTASRPRPRDLEKLLRIDARLLDPPPTRVALLDDVLTTGCHFRAVKKVLSEEFSDIEVVGFFIARVVRDPHGPQ